MSATLAVVRRRVNVHEAPTAGSSITMLFSSASESVGWLKYQQPEYLSSPSIASCTGSKGEGNFKKQLPP